MKNGIVKQVVGIDIAMDSFEACYGSLDDEQGTQYSKSAGFTNNAAGFAAFSKWVNAHGKTSCELWYVMEATGVYYESLAYYLAGGGGKVSVMLATKIRHYQKSLEVKSKTDSIDACILTRLGLERKLCQWKVPSMVMQGIKMLSREYRENKQKLNVIKNQLHAKDKAYKASAAIVSRLKAQVSLLEKQCVQIQKELKQCIAGDASLKQKTDKLQTIPGVGFMTVVTVVSETNGFALIQGQKQLVSYAGMDIKLNESGQSQRPSRMSKRGNKFIRHAVYMPALSALQFNKELKVFYHKLVQRKKVKKIAVTAVSRKLLCLIYTLWKKEECYQQNYSSQALKKEEGSQSAPSSQDAHQLKLS